MKSKKVLTILLSLAIMVTFMPTFAFAAVETKGTYQDQQSTTGYVEYTATWADDFSTVTIGDRTFETVRTMVDAQTSENAYGERTVESWSGEMQAVIKIDQSDEDYGKYGNLAPVYYYDTQFAVGAIGEYALPSKSITQSSFESKYVVEQTNGYYDWRSGATVRFMVPSYIRGYSSFSPETKAATFAAPGFNRTVELSDISAYEAGKLEDQSFKVSVSLSVPASAAATAVNVTGGVADSEFVVSKFKTDTSNAKVNLDSIDNLSTEYYNGYLTGLYDGQSHTVVAEDVAGWTKSFQVYNPSTAKYEDVASITISDVRVKAGTLADDPILAKVVYKKAGMIDQEKAFKVNLTPATVKFGFDEEQSIVDPVKVKGDTYTRTYYDYEDGVLTGTHSYSYQFEEEVNNITYSTEGSTFDAMSYVVAEPAKATLTGWSTSKGNDADKAWLKAYNAANKSAVEANKATIESFKADMFEVKETPSKADPNKIKLQLQEKSLTSAETKAMLAKYGQLIANFDLDELDEEVNAEWTATMLINQATPVVNDKDDDINFTGVTKVVYSGKKAIKSKKLKKAQSFTVSATADSGKAVTYVGSSTDKKIKVNAAGKVTVKKGLKSGTYKVKVTAKTVAGEGYKAAKTTETYTIVVKKK